MVIGRLRTRSINRYISFLLYSRHSTVLHQLPLTWQVQQSSFGHLAYMLRWWRHPQHVRLLLRSFNAPTSYTSALEPIPSLAFVPWTSITRIDEHYVFAQKTTPTMGTPALELMLTGRWREQQHERRGTPQRQWALIDPLLRASPCTVNIGIFGNDERTYNKPQHRPDDRDQKRGDPCRTRVPASPTHMIADGIHH